MLKGWGCEVFKNKKRTSIIITSKKYLEECLNNWQKIENVMLRDLSLNCANFSILMSINFLSFYFFFPDQSFNGMAKRKERNHKEIMWYVKSIQTSGFAFYSMRRVKKYQFSEDITTKCILYTLTCVWIRNTFSLYSMTF